MKKIYIFLLFTLLNIFAVAQTTIVDSIMCGGIYRNYRLYIPAVYTGATARPLVFDLHGYTSNATQEQSYSNFKPIADTANILMVYPNGTLLSGQPYWNAGFGPGVDDIQFISNLIDTLKSQYNIDANSVYSCGMSNGGYMSHTLACALNNKIAAVASVTGTMATTQYNTCVPNRAVPVMQISGTNDPTVTYTGSTGSLAIDTVVHYWVMNNNCNTTPVFNAVPNTNVSDGCTAEHYVYNGGVNGSSVELYKIIGGAHTWPGSPYIIAVTNEDFNASEKIWLFFRKYKLNQFTGIDELKNNFSVAVYPNPFTSQTIIAFDEEQKNCILKITDIFGTEVTTIKFSGKQYVFQKNEMKNGIYFLQIINENKNTQTKKIIVQ
jgi:polyhydroxybutyrate depolymerase